MNPFLKVWFWLLILSIIGFIITFVAFERNGQTYQGQPTPWWVWALFVFSAILLIASLILFCIDRANYYRQLEIAEACGELPPPPPKKKIECPKKECKEKKIIECTETNEIKKPCVTNQVTPVLAMNPSPVNTPLIVQPEIQPQAFAAANNKYIVPSTITPVTLNPQ